MKSKYYESFEYDINHSEAGLQIQKRYEILEEIYRSEQSVLYRINSKDTNTISVLKGIQKKNGFSFEVDNVMKIKSPHINCIIESYESEIYLYLIEEFVEGMNLEQYIQSNGVMNEKEAIKVITLIASAIGVLHNHKDSKYVFRDLKPSNIMIKPNGDVVLIDVITIREVKENQTQDTFLIGSKGYTAPEAYGFMQTTEKSDIYSLGATLFFLQTGIQPGNISSWKEQLTKHNEIPRYLKRIIDKCMAFNPKDRFSDVSAFIRAIETKGVKKTGRNSLYMGFVILSLIAVSFIFNEYYSGRMENDKVSENLIVETSDVNPTITEEITKEIPEVPEVESTTDKSLIEIKTGFQFTLYDTNVLRIEVDRNQIDESIKDFRYINVGTSEVPITPESLNNLIGSKGGGFQFYRTEGYMENLVDTNCLFIALYDNDENPIAYYVNNDIRENLNVVTIDGLEEPSPDGPTIPKSEIYSVAEGVNFEYYSEHAVLLVDKDKVPVFSKVSIWNNINPFTEADVAFIKDTLANEGGWDYYDDGVPTGFGGADTFFDCNWLIYLLDDENGIVEEYRIDK